jgi:phage terminase Nu1 subunit (DNA packaging protein)
MAVGLAWEPMPTRTSPKSWIRSRSPELLGHDPKQIRIWAKQRTLPARRGANGRQYLFDRDQVIDWMRSHRAIPDD